MINKTYNRYCISINCFICCWLCVLCFWLLFCILWIGHFLRKFAIIYLFIHKNRIQTQATTKSIKGINQGNQSIGFIWNISNNCMYFYIIFIETLVSVVFLFALAFILLCNCCARIWKFLACVYVCDVFCFLCCIIIIVNICCDK